MASSLKTLSDDDNRYQKSFKVFLTRSSEHQRMLDFIHGKLPDILENVGDGSPHLNVIGVGSGEGSIDLELLAVLRHKHPEAKVDNEVVEPSSEQLHKYKISVSQKTELAHVNFNWNRMTASEFEAKWTEGTMKKKADFIHMIQMLYYVKDPRATISFFQSLLKRNGKLLIILVSGQSGWAKLWGTFKDQICHSELSQCVTTADIRSILDSAGVNYQGYQLTSRMDISECFVEGDENGDMLLDFLTEVSNFNRTASPELKASIMEMLRHPDCSVEVDGKIMFNNNLEALVLDALP